MRIGRVLEQGRWKLSTKKSERGFGERIEKLKEKRIELATESLDKVTIDDWDAIVAKR
jgi:hypothetical protein